ncbi:MAG: response regulator transcription factor [Brevundimonas sp.]|uniref:response regulator transcription factor n=1 Tax=Brevundimonas sp. TaxID=1871086 RepID=UPI002734DC84|nr:response regulator transcription factor [Brevundimonas sp.]MDP3658389.1 response regulator transcription factor [Brevundimonas sp.]MDZ4109629.1 response regulator transcription factor [Brevundimonas sp.]MDZ4317377.1 response regulator transcription factor [Phenylobacterium sp.]
MSLAAVIGSELAQSVIEAETFKKRACTSKSNPCVISRPSVSLVIEEKPICAGAFAHCLRSDCGVDEVRLERSLADEKIRASEGPYVVVLVDLATINYDFGALEAIVARLDPSPVIAVDDRPNPAFASLAASINCRGYIAKTIEEEQLKQQVRSVISGQSCFPDGFRQEGVSPDWHATKRMNVLTERQSAVLACVARGLSNNEIAQELGISIGTVKTHVHAVLRRVGARNRTEAAIVAPRFHALGKRLDMTESAGEC